MTLRDKTEKMQTPEFSCMRGPEKAYERAVEDTTLVAEEYIANLQKKLAKVIKKWSAAESEAYDLRAALTPNAETRAAINEARELQATKGGE